MDVLNKKYLKEKLLKTNIADYSEEILSFPEKVLQIGEGNFLRAFVDSMLHKMNKAGIFKGRAVVVQPIAQGKIKSLNRQDCLYTLYLRGINQGQVINNKEIITSISRGLNAYSQWEEVLKLAENPNMEYIFSNTTEAGIAYTKEDRLSDCPPDSFPGKLTVYLYHRFQYFQGAKDKGMVIIPVELIENNGTKLKEIILKIARDWNLNTEFITWIKEDNIFLNTLVDRIVTGYPYTEVVELENELGYQDENMTTGEIFHLWVIEGDEQLKEKLPFHKVGLNVKWVKDLSPYRQRKVRILNGAHTSTVAVSYLAGIDLVREAVKDITIGQFMQKLIYENVIPGLDFAKNEIEDFAQDVFERFENPFIDHKWLDISLNSISKFKTRVLPSILAYMEKKKELPIYLCFSWAALIAFYQIKKKDGEQYIALRKQEEYVLQDEQEVLNFYYCLWQDYDQQKIDLDTLVEKVLKHKKFWGEDLSQLPKLKKQLSEYLAQILTKGMETCLSQIINKK